MRKFPRSESMNLLLALRSSNGRAHFGRGHSRNFGRVRAFGQGWTSMPMSAAAGSLLPTLSFSPTTFLLSPAKALKRSRDTFRKRLAELPPAAPLPACDPFCGTYWFPDITGWLSEAEALYLYSAIKLWQPQGILEIGTFYGRSTATICAAIEAMRNSARFVRIDLDLRAEHQVQRTFGEIPHLATSAEK
jgi:hypothetical protein